MNLQQTAERLAQKREEIRHELAIPPGEHLLDGKRMLDIHQALCRRYPQGERKLPLYLRYGVAFSFVKEHLIAALREKHGFKLDKKQEARVRKLIGAIYFHPPASEHQRRIRAAEALGKEGWCGKAIYKALCKESEHLSKQDDEFTGMHRGAPVTVKTMQPGENPLEYRARLLADAKAALQQRVKVKYRQDVPTDLFSNVIPKFAKGSSLVDVQKFEADSSALSKRNTRRK